MKLISIIFTFLFFTQCVFAAHIHPEKYYQELWCNARGGKLEVVLPDGARVDCLTKDYAVEFDFANKWAESIGQSLYYALITKRTPAVVLILEQPQKEQKYLNRLQKVADKYQIKVFTQE